MSPWHPSAAPKAGCPMHDSPIVMRGFIDRQVDHSASPPFARLHSSKENSSLKRPRQPGAPGFASETWVLNAPQNQQEAS